jgi:hypothetical protein
MINARILNDSIAPGRNFDKALFRLWYPDESKFIGGIIVLMPGSNGDGRSSVEDSLWQVIASKHNFALLGCYFTDHQHPFMDIENYVNVKEGSGQALLDVISVFANKSARPEIEFAPLVFWGHSAGGEFNYEFACWKPERVIAFVVNKGGFYYTAVAPCEARDVPGLFFTGEKDLDARNLIVKGLFSMNRRAGALWAYAEEPAAGHEVGKTMKLASVFFDEVIPLRLSEMLRTGNQKTKLSSLSPVTGYIGDFKMKTLFSYADGVKLNYPASWLVSQKFAGCWLSFIKGISF